MEQTLVPKLRFGEFNTNWEKTVSKNKTETPYPDWEDKKLGEIATFTKGKGISKNDLDPDGKTACIRYGELYTKYSETISDVLSTTSTPFNELVLSHANDVIIPASGETHIDIATASCVVRKDIALGGDLNIIRSNANGVFLAYYLNNAKKHQIAGLAQGSSVIHLYASQLKDLKIELPSPVEQTKIAAFLTSVDSRIEQLQRKKSLLQDYKKGVMSRLFAASNDQLSMVNDQCSESKPINNSSLTIHHSLRFRDENGEPYPDWEHKKLGEVCLKKSSNITAGSLRDIVGEYSVYGASGEMGSSDTFAEDQEFIGIVKDGAGVGKTMLCKPYTSVLGTMDIIKEKQGNHLRFIYGILNLLNFNKHVNGSTIPHIYFKDYSRENIAMPSLPEQTKIATFLSTLDIKIEQVTQQITQTQTFKKGLLQQMFV